MPDEPPEPDAPLPAAEACGSSTMPQEKYQFMGPMFLLALTLLIRVTFAFSRVFIRYFKKRRVPVFPERKDELYVPPLAKDPCETAKPDCNDEPMELANNDRDVAKRLGPSQQKVRYKWTIPSPDRKRIDQLLVDLLSVEDLRETGDRGVCQTPFAGNWAPILDELISEAHRRYSISVTKNQKLTANIEDQTLISMNEDSTNESNGQIEYACQLKGKDMGDRCQADAEPFIEEISCIAVEENEADGKDSIHEEHVDVSKGVPSQGLSTENQRESNVSANTEHQENSEVLEVTKSCEMPKATSGSPSLKTMKSTSWKLDKRPSLSSLSSASSKIEEPETPKSRDKNLSEKTRIREPEPNVKGRRKDRRKDSKKRTALILPPPASPPGFLKPPPQDWVSPSPKSPKPLVAPPPGFGLLKPHQFPLPGLDPPKRHLRANAPVFTPRFNFPPPPPVPHFPSFPELSSDSTCDSISRTERSSTAASGCSSRTLSFDDHPFMAQSEEMYNLVGSRGTPIDDGHDADDELDSYYYEEGRPSVDLSFLES